MTMPNFLIIGDLKAGSTSLHSYLKQHPEVYMPPGLKELRYFSYDKTNPYHAHAGSYRVRSLEDYRAYFEASGGTKAIGEASPNYLRSPGAAKRIHQHIPEARLIVCLRNPADRLFSLYQMHFRAGATRKRFDEYAFTQDATWIKGNFYWPDLNSYYQLFARERINVLIFDDLKVSPQKVAADVYRFLGVNDSFVPDLTAQNTGGVPKSAFLYSSLITARNVFKKFATPPAALRRTWSDVKKRSLTAADINPMSREKILEICKDDIDRTQDLIRCDLSGWLK